MLKYTDLINGLIIIKNLDIVSKHNLVCYYLNMSESKCCYFLELLNISNKRKDKRIKGTTLKKISLLPYPSK